MPEQMVSAVRATECGHVLAFADSPPLIERLTFDYDALVSMGDTRFELTRMTADMAGAAFMTGLDCKRCLIVVEEEVTS